MSDPLCPVLLVCEGPSDVRRARAVIDAWVERREGWLADHPVADRFGFVGPDDTQLFLKTKHIPTLARERGLKGFGGPMPASDGGTVRALLLLLRHNQALADRAQFVLWLRDADGDPDREPSARAERDKLRGDRFPLAIGYARQCGEAWAIAGLTATGEHHSFKDPSEFTHKEVSGGAKDVLNSLIGKDADQEARAIEALVSAGTPAGDAVGLTAFLNDLDTHWAPALGV